MSNSQPNATRNKWRTRARIALAALMIVGGLYALALGIAYAISDPDTITINDVRAYDSVIETDDLLVLVDYNLDYGSIPDEVISDAFVGRFLRSATELNSIEPFPFNDKGYGRGIYSFYWTGAQKDTDSIEFENPNSESYEIQLRGKPAVFPGMPPTTETSTIQWQDATNTKFLLSEYIKGFAQTLEFDAAWAANSQDLISSALLTDSGADYFSNAIPQLSAMVPQIFSEATTSVDFATDGFDKDLAEDLGTFWEGNWVDTKFQTLADTYQVPKTLLTAGFSLFWITMIMWFTAKVLDNTSRANEYGVMTVAVTLPMFGAVGWMPLEIVMITAAIAVVGLGWTLIGKRT